MQQRFDTEMDLTVSMCGGGFQGTSNTGPTVKAAFQDVNTLANIVHAPLDLVYGLKTVFSALNNSDDELLSPERFKEFGNNWLDSLANNDSYNWNVTNPSVHLIMKHGHMFFPLVHPIPTPWLSEEGAESDNKVLRDTRLHHSRQTNPKDQITDCMNRSHYLSDPLVQDLLPDPKVQDKIYTPEVIALFAARQPPLEPPVPSEAKSKPNEVETEPPEALPEPMDLN